jgi:tRNA(fMet)-specific endonuclease VapC
MGFLLDTMILSDLIRRPQGQAFTRLRSIEEADIFTSIIVAAEIRFGLAKAGSARLTARATSILDHLTVLPFQAPADVVYGDVRARLEKGGQLIGLNDMLIAAHALTFGHTLVTDNEREFRRVEGLRIENWLR